MIIVNPIPFKFEDNKIVVNDKIIDELIKMKLRDWYINVFLKNKENLKAEETISKMVDEIIKPFIRNLLELNLNHVRSVLNDLSHYLSTDEATIKKNCDKIHEILKKEKLSMVLFLSEEDFDFIYGFIGIGRGSLAVIKLVTYDDFQYSAMYCQGLSGNNPLDVDNNKGPDDAIEIIKKISISKDFNERLIFIYANLLEVSISGPVSKKKIDDYFIEETYDIVVSPLDMSNYDNIRKLIVRHVSNGYCFTVLISNQLGCEVSKKLEERRRLFETLEKLVKNETQNKD